MLASHKMLNLSSELLVSLRLQSRLVNVAASQSRTQRAWLNNPQICAIKVIHRWWL